VATEPSSSLRSRQPVVRSLVIAAASAAAGLPFAPAIADDATETPASMVDALHSAFGQHHVRAVHAKGTILQGTFTPTPQARELSQAPVFASGNVPVTVRFSDFTGLPDIPDNVGEASPRGFAVKFRLPKGSELDVVTHSFNGFPTRTSDEFAQLLRAIGKSGPDAPKPTELDQFLSSHPIAKTFLATQKPPPVSYGTLTYFGVNAFTFVDAKQQRQPVRYRFVPAAGEHVLDSAALKAKGANYLQDEIAARVSASPIAFDWYAQIAGGGDLIDDPSIAWPESRRLVKLGTVTIIKLVADSAADKALLFVPGRLPAGIEIADPMVAMRSAAYPLSFGERQ
jgi:catalase